MAIVDMVPVTRDPIRCVCGHRVARATARTTSAPENHAPPVRPGPPTPTSRAILTPPNCRRTPANPVADRPGQHAGSSRTGRGRCLPGARWLQLTSPSLHPCTGTVSPRVSVAKVHKVRWPRAAKPARSDSGAGRAYAMTRPPARGTRTLPPRTVTASAPPSPLPSPASRPGARAPVRPAPSPQKRGPYWPLPDSMRLCGVP